MNKNINNIVFDFGGVLINWNPRHLYKKIFTDRVKMENFLTNICTQDWNEEQDAGRTFEEGINVLSKLHPQYSKEISLYYDRWEEMLDGSIQESVLILEELKQMNALNLYGLTNWSAQTFPFALEKFKFLQYFEGILVSGQVGLKKPDPKIFNLLCDKYHISAKETVFIDDTQSNIVAANKLGFYGIHFQSSQKLREELKKINILV